MKMRHILTLCGLLIAVLAVFAGRVRADDNRELTWERYDVDITNINTTANSFHVAEKYTLRIVTGPFNGGDARIPLDRVTSLNNIVVTDGGRPLQTRNNVSADNCGTQRGIVCLSRSGNNEVIYYNWFQQANDGDTRQINIEYDVIGGLRSYPDGDQLFWKAVSDDKPFPVQASRVSVELPAGLTAQKVASYPDWKQSNENNTLYFDSPGTIGATDGVEVRIQYPHNPAMAVPGWQAAYDRSISLQPLISLLMLVVAGLIAVGGLVFVILRYASHKRGLPPIVVPEYLSEPPSDQPPGVVGTLIDGSADTKDVMSTLFDLARRGLIVIEQEEHKGVLGIGGGMEFTFHRTDATDAGLRPYESMMLRDIFRGGTVRKLSELRDKFYSTVEKVKAELYNENVRAGYYKQSPSSVRGGWIVMGILLLVLAGGVLYLAFGVKSLPLGFTSGAIALPGFAFGFLGVVMMGASTVMASRSAAGEQEAAKWKAFRHYLQNIQKYTDLKQATDQFERYIGYAIVFGLEKQWIGQFSNVMTSMPTWYYPTYIYGPWSGRYPTYGYGYGGMNRMGGLGESAGGFKDVQRSASGSGGLTGMSNDLSKGLSGMSAGLAGLLTSASSVMTSKPSSSGSGGFSGGGGHGGGGGGGSRGFH